MGLDAVEMVMQTEERFGIVISDGEAEAVRTPGMLIDLVFSKLTVSDERFCRSQRAFYLVRRALHADFAVERAAIHPGADLRALTPGVEEAQFWPRLKECVRARSWPKLDFSREVRFRIAAASWLLFATVIWVFAWAGWGHMGASAFAWGTLLATVVAILFDDGLRKHLSGMRRFIPVEVKTLRDLVPFAETSDLITWTREGVAREIRAIVLEVLGIKPEKYREDADFVKDLGMG
jgi:acyl carrier protein